MIIKRSFDLLFGLFLFIVLFPLMIFIALLILMKMGPPFYFRQQRPGLGGRPFYLYKFRTMSDGKDKLGQDLPEEERLTNLGRWLRKYSLDELPQLLNVIRGELSFVGPRPLLMKYLPRYNMEQARRHEVKPGLTGWAQVNGRNAISWEEKFAYDVWYVDNHSFGLDLKVLWLTLIRVIKAEGINQDGAATMSEFMGIEEVEE